MRKLLRILEILMMYTGREDLDVQNGEVFLSGLPPESMSKKDVAFLYNEGARYDITLESWVWRP